jgi:ribose-phosphate pyrophosphokinase
MIKVQDIVVKPTIFPDGTSQMWHLPDGLFDADTVKITWNFEAEREMMDLASLRYLTPKFKYITLHIPYLPYGRQDKDVSNDTTFNLHVFAAFINSLDFDRVSVVDPHNWALTEKLIHNFVPLNVEDKHQILYNAIKPDLVVFPDAGARDRYDWLKRKPNITFLKMRDSKTGTIISHLPDFNIELPVADPHKFLIVDDICDGGATFLSVAKSLKVITPKPDIYLFVTHGLFSKGIEPLTEAGIKVYTTNSLVKNVGGFRV